MQSFGEFRAPRPRVHLSHLEDLVLQGRASDAVGILIDLVRWLDGEKPTELVVSVKWDGAPAIIFGPDPADGRFFVSTKAALSQTPKLAKSHAEIDALFDADVASILHVCFDELPALKATTPIQGDFLFRAKDVRLSKVDARWEFTPNIITYVYPWVSDGTGVVSPHVLSRAMGIVLHTRLDGWVAQPMTEEDFECLGTTDRVLVINPRHEFDPHTAFSTNDALDFDGCISKARAVAVDDALIDAMAGPMFGLVPMYINACVRSLDTPTADGLFHWLGARANALAERRKTSTGKLAVFFRFAEMVTAVITNRGGWTLLFDVYLSVQRAKDLVVQRLSTPSVAGFWSYIEGEPCGPEGFVVTHPRNGAYKLVNRAEFSRINMLTSRFRTQSLNTEDSGV